jgi:hypothetical protein
MTSGGQDANREEGIEHSLRGEGVDCQRGGTSCRPHLWQPQVDARGAARRCQRQLPLRHAEGHAWQRCHVRHAAAMSTPGGVAAGRRARRWQRWGEGARAWCRLVGARGSLGLHRRATARRGRLQFLEIIRVSQVCAVSQPGPRWEHDLAGEVQAGPALARAGWGAVGGCWREGRLLLTATARGTAGCTCSPPPSLRSMRCEWSMNLGCCAVQCCSASGWAEAASAPGGYGAAPCPLPVRQPAAPQHGRLTNPQQLILLIKCNC